MSAMMIIAHMKDLLSLHRTLLEWSDSKKQSIIDNQVNDLAQWVNKEMRMMKKIAETQERWREAVSEFLASKGMKPDHSTTITDIAGFLEHEADRTELTGLQQQLLEAIQELKTRNALNQQLIEQSLAYINYSIDLYTGGFAQEATYRNPAQNKPSPAGGKHKVRFDTRA